MLGRDEVLENLKPEVERGERLPADRADHRRSLEFEQKARQRWVEGRGTVPSLDSVNQRSFRSGIDADFHCGGSMGKVRMSGPERVESSR